MAKGFTPKKICELALAYNVSTKTLHRWFKPIKDKIGKRKGHFYNLDQLKVIYEHYGNPFE